MARSLACFSYTLCVVSFVTAFLALFNNPPNCALAFMFTANSMATAIASFVMLLIRFIVLKIKMLIINGYFWVQSYDKTGLV